MDKGTKKPRAKDGIHALAVEILRESKKPLSVSEITKRILRKRSIESKRPDNTVYAVLYRSSQTKLVSPGMFALREDKSKT